MTFEKKIERQYEYAIEKFMKRLKTNTLYDLGDENNEIHYQISKDYIWYNGEQFYSFKSLSKAGGYVKEVFRLLKLHGNEIIVLDTDLYIGLEYEFKSVKKAVKEFIKKLW